MGSATGGVRLATSSPTEDHRSARRQSGRRGSVSVRCPMAQARARPQGWHTRPASRRARWICRSQPEPKAGSVAVAGSAGGVGSDGDDAPTVDVGVECGVWWPAAGRSADGRAQVIPPSFHHHCRSCDFPGPRQTIGQGLHSCDLEGSLSLHEWQGREAEVEKLLLLPSATERLAE